MKHFPSKSIIHQACLAELSKKKQGLQAHIRDAQQAAAEDTKSSAGDKFETSREMMKQEIQKAQQQLAIYEKMEEVMMKIKADEKRDQLGLGSLLITDEAVYYFSVSLGQLMVEGEKVYMLSMASPLGKMMNGRKEGELVNFRNRKIKLRQLL